jgi:hypothetical protein
MLKVSSGIIAVWQKELLRSIKGAANLDIGGILYY